MPQVSTIKSSNRSVHIPKKIIILGKILQSISTSLAAKYASKIFITPFPYPTPKRELEMQQKSRQKFVKLKAYNKTICVYEYGQSERKILLVHGWSGRGTQLFKIADALLKQGYMTVSFDAPAHGQSPGKTTMMPHFIAACLELSEQYGGFHAAVGHSLGGMSLLNATGKGLQINKLVVIGTGDSITEISKEFIENLGLKEVIATKMKAYFDRNHKQDLDELSASVAAKDVNIPVLVVHDKDDKDVHVHCARQIDANLSHSELLITEKLGHRQILGNKEVIEKIITFVNKKNEL
ncbi:MAG: alpha/beta hydrolase [Flavobacteriaceae bacterium]|nr:alpha/beta hydrolase [Flavobacteriaceae bacterium]